jgi:NAD(P)-dependent dehydrogenase (short-subunit alcohol dehydrogenase family)
MKTVIITGANGNLGTVVTNSFLSSGYKVIAVVLDEDSKKNFITHNNLQIEAVNLSDEAETVSFIDKLVNEHQTIDVALLLAGGFDSGNIDKATTGNIRKQISLNFETAYNVTRPLFQHMTSKGYGRIVFVGARPALQASAGKDLLAYALSKSLLFKLAEFLNEEAKGKNITTTVIVPSIIDTVFNRRTMPDVNPADWVTAETLSDILEFIVSDKSAPLRETVLKVYNNS